MGSKMIDKLRTNYRKVASLWKKFRFLILKDGFARADFLRKHNYLAGIGEDVIYYSRIFPADAKLLKIGSHVDIATNVRFLGHDGINRILSAMYSQNYTRTHGCIEVGNYVFIGSDSIILPNIRIGDNTIIGAGSIVTKDLEPGFIWGGVPAKRIGVFQDLIDRRKDDLHPEKRPEELWKSFYAQREPMDIQQQKDVEQ